MAEAPLNLQDFYALSPLGYLTLCNQGTILDSNPAGAALLGASEEALLQSPFSRYVVAAEQPFWDSYLLAALGQPTPRQGELTLCQAGGKTVAVRVDGLRVQREQPAPQLRLVLTDISELKQARESRDRAAHLLAEAQRITRIGSWYWDAITDAIWWSDELYTIYSRDPFLAPPKYEEDQQNYTPESGAALTEVVQKALQTGQSYEIDLQLSVNTSPPRWVTARGEVRRNASGNIVGLSGTVQDNTERKHMEKQISQLAFFDTLTKLPNRRLLEDHLHQYMAASKRSNKYGALILLDMDNFKPLNDAQGHIAGDLLLIEVAQRLSSCVREMDTVSRFGGDEFVIALSELDIDKASSAEQALGVADKIRISLAKPYLLMLEQNNGSEVLMQHQCVVADRKLTH